MIEKALAAGMSAVICGLFALLFSYISEKLRLHRFEITDKNMPHFYYRGRYYDLYKYVKDKANSLDSRWLKDSDILEKIEVFEEKIKSGKDVYYNAAIVNAYKLLSYKRNKSFPEAAEFLNNPLHYVGTEDRDISTTDEHTNQESHTEAGTSKPVQHKYCRFCGKLIDADSCYCIYCGADLGINYGNTEMSNDIVTDIIHDETEVSYTHTVCSNDIEVNPSVEELRKYKYLLDEGLITQEDYDLKKEQILSRY